MVQQELWRRIQVLPIGPGDAPLSFTSRLARENGWAPAYAEAVVEEYRRFVYLVAATGEELTPSDQVDQAWHLHMTYTRSYWHDLCRDTLGRELHHRPTRGGADQQARFRRQYRRTLAVYRDAIGASPPPDLWPAVEQRFRDADRFVRVNRADHWVLPRPRPGLIKGLGAGGLALLLAACSESPGGYDIWFWLKVAFGVWVLYKLFSWLDSGGRGGGSSGGGGCGGCAGCGGGD